MSSLNERVAVVSKQIDATIDALVANADTPEQVEALNQERNELHSMVAKRAFAESLKGFTHE